MPLGRNSTAVSLATRNLSDTQRSIYFAGSCKGGTEELYELVRRIYKGLRWQTPDGEIENMLGQAVWAVVGGDVEVLSEIRGRIEGLLPY